MTKMERKERVCSAEKKKPREERGKIKGKNIESVFVICIKCDI